MERRIETFGRGSANMRNHLVGEEKLSKRGESSSPAKPPRAGEPGRSYEELEERGHRRNEPLHKRAEENFWAETLGRQKKRGIEQAELRLRASATACMAVTHVTLNIGGKF